MMPEQVRLVTRSGKTFLHVLRESEGVFWGMRWQYRADNRRRWECIDDNVTKWVPYGFKEVDDPAKLLDPEEIQYATPESLDLRGVISKRLSCQGNETIH